MPRIYCPMKNGGQKIYIGVVAVVGSVQFPLGFIVAVPIFIMSLRRVRRQTRFWRCNGNRFNSKPGMVGQTNAKQMARVAIYDIKTFTR